MPAAATAWPCAPGERPPGIAMVTFEVERLPGTPAARIGTVERPAALPCGARRSCACVGLAGEFIELVESG